jgi:hypothetical protein
MTTIACKWLGLEIVRFKSIKYPKITSLLGFELTQYDWGLDIRLPFIKGVFVLTWRKEWKFYRSPDATPSHPKARIYWRAAVKKR